MLLSNSLGNYLSYLERATRFELVHSVWKTDMLAIKHHARINTVMHTYDAITKTGLVIHLSMSDEHTFYILVFDIDNFKLTMKFFNNIETALSFIQSL